MSTRPTILAEGLVFPEGPRWHDGRLWLSDIHAHQVVTVDLDGRVEVIAVVDKPSGLGFLPDGTPLVVSMHDQTLLRLPHNADGPGGSRRPELHADLNSFPGEFLNDMVVDDAGRAYVGKRSWRRRGEPPAPDCVLLVHPDGTPEVAAGDLNGPNGTVITPDGATLIVAETHGLRLTAFERDSDGRLHNRRMYASLADGVFPDGKKAFPDGICLDAEGAVWVGTAISGAFLRVLPGGGIDQQVIPNAPWATACALGGPDRRTLFLATCHGSLEALGSLNDADGSDHDAYLRWARTQMQGSVETIPVEIPGAGLP